GDPPLPTRRWPRPPPSGGVSSTSGSGHESDRDDHRTRVRPQPRRRRHRPDHPQAVPQARRAHRLRRVPVFRLGQGAPPGFADIFRSNCTKIGLLPVELPADAVRAIADAGEAQVDLAEQEVRWPGGSASFDIDPEIKHRLLNGLDDIALTLQQDAAIAAYERDRERSGPVTTAL